VGELPDVFVPVAGGWGRSGATHIRLASATVDVLSGALRTAWRLGLEKNAKSPQKKRTADIPKAIAPGRKKRRAPVL